MGVPAVRYDSGMAIPATGPGHATSGGQRAPWSTLDPAAKRRRLLAAAETVFARDGLDAPVPAIAAEAGAGVGSVYRAFASKDDIVSALAVERLGWFTERAGAAAAAADPGGALVDLLRAIVARGARDHVLAAAVESAIERPDLAPARAAALAACELLLERVAAQGAFRDDLVPGDIGLVLAGVRTVEAAERGTGARLLELTLSGLRR
jgi:AcrR family transcriptional regulator